VNCGSKAHRQSFPAVRNKKLRSNGRRFHADHCCFGLNQSQRGFSLLTVGNEAYPKKPRINSAHVDGSGTALVKLIGIPVSDANKTLSRSRSQAEPYWLGFRNRARAPRHDA
jgi:hypothetical protein